MSHHETLRHTPFFDFYAAHGGKLIPFGEWELPVHFSGGIRNEHLAVRTGVGLFDVSHMGEIDVTGPRAIEAVNWLVTNNVGSLTDGKALYSPMCYEDGGIVDDLLVYRIGHDRIMLCVNAANVRKDFEWIAAGLGRFDVGCRDASDDWGQLALQGPKSPLVIEKIWPAAARLAAFHFLLARLEGSGAEVVISRTGYTGEDGFELYVPRADCSAVWNRLMDAGREYGLVLVGLGARDTLRLEKRLPLYGNDIDRTTNPIEAGLGWTVKFDAGDFCGREALLAVKQAGPVRRLVCLLLSDKAIPRQHCAILKDGQPVGEVTSGTFSPSLQRPIAMGYVPEGVSQPGSRVEIQIRQNAWPAEVIKPPFVK